VTIFSKKFKSFGLDAFQEFTFSLSSTDHFEADIKQPQNTDDEETVCKNVIF